MHFPSISVFTTLAFAAFSFAAPLSLPPAIDGAKAEIDNALANVPRDVPAVPSTAVSPLVGALTGFVTELETAVAVLVNVVDGKVKVEVDTQELHGALVNVVAVVASHVEPIKKAAVLSVDNVQTQVVAGLLVKIVTTVYTALNTVAGVEGLVVEALAPVVAQVTTHLAGVVSTVQSTVPGVLELVVVQVKYLYITVEHLSIASILTVLGMDSPVS